MNLKSNKKNRMFTFGFAFLFLTLGSTQVWADANADNSASVQAVQQQSVAKGRVVDANGEPLVGVSVFEEGSTSNGTITDADGNFTLSVPRNASIVVSYVGFETQSLRATGNMNVVLQEESNELNEVIVVGYGTQKKADLSGSVVAVNVEQLAASRPISNIGTAMAGQVAGLTVLQSGNNIPGAENPKMLIRGTGTMNEAGPLVIIDGVEGYLNDVDASDIEQVTVLKDAASAAIYGSRAANGVILVTTKSGKKGQMKIGYNGYVTFQSARVGNMKPVSDFAKHMEYMNEAYANNGEAAPYSQDLINEWRNNPNDPLGHPNTDWVKEIFGTGVGTKHSVYMQGGTEKVDFYGSFGFNNNPGVVENTGYKKYTALANIVAHVNKYLDMGMNFSGYYGTADMGGMRGEDGSFNTGWSHATSPATIFRYNDMYGGIQDPTAIGGTNNILANLNGTRGNNISRNGRGRFFVTVKPLEGLDITGTLVYDYFDRNYRGIPVLHDQYNFAPVAKGGEPILIAPATSLNPITQNNYRNQRNYTDVVAHYNKRFVEDKLGFGLMLGASQEMYTTENEQITREGLSDLSLSVLSAASGTITKLTGGKSTWSMRSYFGRLNLDWDNKYYFQASLRGDGSSRFLEKNRWGWFPSFSAAWRISEEAFMKDNGIFDNLKLRVGYGSLGNNAIGNYAAFSNFGIKNTVIGDVVQQGLYASSPANPRLTWEKTKTFTVGLDFATLGQRLTGSIEYYNKKTDGILLWVELPNAGGDWSGMSTNAAEVSNKGVELNLGWNDKIGDFRYGINLNYSHNKNNIDKFRGTDIAGQSMSGNVLTWEGHELGSYYMYRAKLIETDADLNKLQAMLDANPKAFDGVNPQYITTVDGKKVLNRDAALGDIMIEDVNGDGVLTTEDRDIVGHTTPNGILGINLNAGWKGIDFSVTMDGAFGHSGEMNADYYNNSFILVHQINEYVAENAWRKGVTGALYPRLTSKGLFANNIANTIWLKSRSFWKIRNIQLGYTLPKQITRKAYIEKLRFFASLENFFTFTGWKGLDPETAGMNYPVLKQALIGVNVEF